MREKLGPTRQVGSHREGLNERRPDDNLMGEFHSQNWPTGGTTVLNVLCGCLETNKKTVIPYAFYTR